MSIAQNIADTKAKIAAAALSVGRNPEEITLIAATKVQTSDTIREAIRAGIGVCGENRVQEMNVHLEDNAYEGACLHFIGHLQTNKVKFVVGKVDLIQSVGSERLLSAIDAQASKLGIVQDILLEINVGDEESKSGFLSTELPFIVDKLCAFPHVRLCGLMAIPPISTEEGGNRGFFAEMYQLFVDTRAQMDDNRSNVTVLSMGMSGDYEDAVRLGATHVRVGTALFGARPPLHATPKHI